MSKIANHVTTYAAAMTRLTERANTVTEELKAEGRPSANFVAAKKNSLEKLGEIAVRHGRRFSDAETCIPKCPDFIELPLREAIFYKILVAGQQVAMKADRSAQSTWLVDFAKGFSPIL